MVVASMLNVVYLTLHQAAGTAIPSFASALLEGDVNPEEEDIIMWTCIDVYLGMFNFHQGWFSAVSSSSSCLFAGGSDTVHLLIPGNHVYTAHPHLQVVSAVHAFFLAMVLFPEVQAKAQAELDAVVGSERLPCFDDRDRLPYVNAVWKEVLRWHSVTPLGMVSASL